MMIQDKKTVAYFDSAIPEYRVKRLKETVKMIDRYRRPDSCLVDIGCGTGSALEFIKKETGIQDLCGIDVSQKSLLKARERIDCATFAGSILDEDLAEKIGKKYDFALLSSVLHHLIGRTRGESMRYALSAVSNSLKLVKYGGYLIIEEPVYSPMFAMSALFYIKKFTTSITPKRRIIIGNRKAYNIGAPVVSFYSDAKLIEMIKGINGAEIADADYREGKVRLFLRLVFITKSGDITIAVKKTPAQPEKRGA